MTKTETKVVLADRFNCTWRTDGEAEVCYTDGGDIVKLNNNKVGEIESLEFDCATYRGCTLSVDETWEYLDQSQSLTALQINTIPFDETYWLKLGHYVNLEGLQAVKNRVRGAVTANVFKKLEILDTVGAIWSHHLSLGPFSSHEELKNFSKQNKSDIGTIRNAHSYSDYKHLTGINYRGTASGDELSTFGSCSFGYLEDPVCHKGAGYKCGAANSGKVICVRDGGLSMHRDKFSDIDFESSTGAESVTIFGVNFDMKKAEIEEVLAGRFNCTWTDGGCATVAGGDVVNSTINKLGEVESLSF
ncbi:hypothetical protein N9C56_15040, partial [Paracoccaceae bacterium]|nr:hypothetical protein [Paracoccaceae bacterium]